MTKTLEQRFQERAFVEKLQRTSSFLPETDRILFEMRVVQGMTLKELSLLTGNSPGSISRRVAKIVGRLESPGYRFVVLYGEHLDPDILKIAKAVYIHGLSIQDTSDLTGISFHRVREARASLEALVQFEIGKQ